MSDIRTETENQIKIGVCAYVPMEIAVVKRGPYDYVIFDFANNTFEKAASPHNLIEHIQRYMKNNNITISSAETQRLLKLAEKVN